MQTQDVSDDFLLRFWPWIEANRNRLIAIGSVAVVAFFIWYYLSTSHREKTLNAGRAYTEFLLNQPPTQRPQDMVGGYMKIAQQYAGTLAGQRAQLQAALGKFDAGKYADAERQFQGFVTAHGDSPLVVSAQLGAAASLEAQGKLNQALTEYRAVVSTYPNTAKAVQAKYACGRVLELQGKLKESVTYYQDVARSPLSGSLAQFAHRRILEMQGKLAAEKKAKPASANTNNISSPGKTGKTQSKNKTDNKS